MILRFGTSSGLISIAQKADRFVVESEFLNGEDIQVVARQPGNPHTLYAGTYGNGLFKTENSGRDWEKLAFPKAFIRSIAFAPENAGLIYVGTEPANLYASDNRGKSWRNLDIRRLPESKEWSLPYSPRAGALRTLALHPGEPGLIIAGVEQGGVIRSVNGGRDWSITHAELPKDVHLISMDQQNHKRLFAATGDGVSLSVDAGASWEPVWDSYTRAILVHPSSPNIVFGGPAEDVGERGSIRMSQDGGATWADAHAGMTFPLPDMVEFFVIHQAWPERVFAVLSDGGVIHTEIDRINWRQFEPRVQKAQFLEIAEQ